MVVNKRAEEGEDYADHIGYVDGRFDLDSLQRLTTPRWAAWVHDRLHRRDPFPRPDPRQGDGPEYLFLDLIPQLGIARKTAKLGICAALHHSATGKDWTGEALSGLFFLIRDLGVGHCASDVLAIARRLAPNRVGLSATKRTRDPYFQALAALSVLQGRDDANCRLGETHWRQLMEPNPPAYFAPCFRGLATTDPAAALSLLSVLDWSDSATGRRATMEIAALMRRVPATPRLTQRLVGLTKNPDAAGAIAAALQRNGGSNESSGIRSAWFWR